jgi:putative sporulation protein YyaC
MANSESTFNETRISKLKNQKQLTTAISATIPAHLTNDNVVFVCIGTDKNTGDSLGPLVGTSLEGLGYTNIVGTLNNPCHAVNLPERIRQIPEDKIIIAIDACLGQEDSVGTYSVYHGPIKLGAALGKNLQEVGKYSILGVVNIGGFLESFVLQNTKPAVVINMAKDITLAVMDVFPLKDGQCEIDIVKEKIANIVNK